MPILRPPLGRLVLLPMLGGSLVGCTRWQIQEIPPQQIIDRAPGEVRITRSDGEQVMLLRPRIVGDTTLLIAGLGISVIGLVIAMNQEPTYFLTERAAQALQQ